MTSVGRLIGDPLAGLRHLYALAPDCFAIARLRSVSQEMVAEDRLDRYPHTEKPLFTANFEKRNGGTRYHNPNGWRLKREYQLLLTAAFAKVHARADHEQLEASKSKASATKGRSRRK